MLYIVGTSIGNIEDTTLRAVKTLVSADVILAEDTRTFGMYYQRIRDLFDLSVRSDQKLLSFHNENEFAQMPVVLDLLREGKNIALVSESGMPVISDPGALLLSHVVKENLPYTVIPGPSALTTAAVLSGFKTDKLLFLGFLSKKESQIRQVFKQYSPPSPEASDGRSNITIIFYESPYRIHKTLKLLKEFNIEKVAICREMTKKFEEVIRGTPAELMRKSYKGELTVAIDF